MSLHHFATYEYTVHPVIWNLVCVKYYFDNMGCILKIATPTFLGEITHVKMIKLLIPYM